MNLGIHGRPDPGRLVWLFYFLYASLAGVAVQFIILPYLLPSLHFGDGLMRGLDSPAFHMQALEIYDAIQSNGWSAWSIRVKGQGIVSITALLYAITGVTKPWIIIPLNALLHATAGVLLFRLFARLIGSNTVAFIASLPFVLFPSSMLWYTQLHKDGFVILGTLLIITGWVTMAENKPLYDGWKRFIIPAIQIPGGASLIWIMRPYHMQLMLTLSALMAIVLSVLFLIRWRKEDLSALQLVISVAFAMVMVIVLTPFAKGGPTLSYSSAGAVSEKKAHQKRMATATNAQAASIAKEAVDEHRVSREWTEIKILPKVINDRFLSIAYYRSFFSKKYIEAGSNIDAAVYFTSAIDVIKYAPRALQISLFAPFPSTWLSDSGGKSASIMRFVAATEMIVVYVALLFFPIAICRWRRQIEFWLIIGICLVCLVFYATIFLNVGTLYRIRYLYLMTFTGLGIAAIIESIKYLLRMAAKGRINNSAKKILFLVTEDWYFWSHRLPLAREALRRGYEVIIATHVNDHAEKIEKEGFQLLPLRLDRSGLNPFAELLSLWQIVALYWREQPHIVHHVAIKPVVYGSFAATIAFTPRSINALGGLGHLFAGHGLKTKILRWALGPLLGMAIWRPSSRTILQNAEDRRMLIDLKMVPEQSCYLIPGAGVNIEIYRPGVEDIDPPIVILASRMLWTKGVDDFVEVARRVNADGEKARFVLAGAPDKHNPESIKSEWLQRWSEEGVIEYWGSREDMPSVMARAAIVTLPSRYGEGVPKALIEGASCQKPLIAYDIPGCRDIVVHNSTGLIVPAGDIDQLQAAVERLLSDPALRLRLGTKGRELVESHFSEKMVVRETFVIYEENNMGDLILFNEY